MYIYSDRLVLRAIERYDRDMLLQLINDPETEKNLGGWSFPVSEAHQESWIATVDNKNELRCIIAEKAACAMGLGMVMLTDIDMKNGNAEIHIKLSPDARGKGYGTEALGAIMKYGFDELRLHCIYGRMIADNTASLRMLEKCGFVREGVMKERFFKNGSYVDVVSLSRIGKQI